MRNSLKKSTKAEKALFVLMDFGNAQQYSNRKYTTCKCLSDLSIYNVLLYIQIFSYIELFEDQRCITQWNI